MKTNKQGDDFLSNRLFSYFKEQFEDEKLEVTSIRKNVFYIKGKEGSFFLKGFPSYHRLKLQETFTSSLKKEGFQQTYSFFDYGKDIPLFFEQTYYGCLEYIEPSEKAFTYLHEEDRKQGLVTLKEFHRTTEKFVSRYYTIVGTFKLLEKWRERTALFINHFSFIKFFIQKEMLDEFLKWGDWALKGMERESDFFQKTSKVILHGDVANHNFLRGKDGKLYLIDFDLISIGYESSDYLQYANRILPYINWSLKELERYEELQPFLKEKGFLYALAFPTDVFREWNRIVKARQYMNTSRVRQVLDLTVGQFKERQQFFNDLKRKME